MKEIILKTNKTDNHLRISVYNSGNQIPKDQIMKIWNKFYKSDASRNREASGSGIGLSLVKAILKQHQNKYGVENKEKGVCMKKFFVSLLSMLLVIQLAACSNEKEGVTEQATSEQSAEIIISAAASLENALNELKPMFENENENVMYRFLSILMVM